MSEPLANFYIQTPYVFVFLAVLLFANVYLALTSYKNRYMLWWSKIIVSKIEGRLRDELQRRLLTEEQFDTKIAEMEQRLEDSESKTFQNEKRVDILHVELSSSMNTAKQSAAMILGEFKKDMLRSINNIEKLEANLSGIHISEKRLLRYDDTLSYRSGENKKVTQHTSHTKQITEEHKRSDITSRQLIFPGFDGPLWGQASTEEN